MTAVADLGAGKGTMVARLSKAAGKGGTVLALDVPAPIRGGFSLQGRGGATLKQRVYGWKS